jgi:hypothetical protein
MNKDDQHSGRAARRTRPEGKPRALLPKQRVMLENVPEKRSGIARG